MRLAHARAPALRLAAQGSGEDGAPAMTAQTVTTPQDSAERRIGIAYAVAAYGQWGFYGLFFKLVSVMNPLEVVAHRAFWSMPVAALALIVMRKLHEAVRAVCDPRVFSKLVVTALLIASNWGFFVWALAMDRTLETSLGYYINPLLNVMIGYVLLGERFTRAQTVAIGLAVLAVCVITVETGVFPWLALLLASTFAAYGYLRKTIPVSAVQGYLVESVILSLVGIPIALWFASTGEAHFLANAHDTVLLLACGPMTALPLMMFAAAARRLRFSTVGLLQYIAPTGLFLTAIFAFGEPVSLGRLVAFALIWMGLAIYTVEAIRIDRRARSHT